MTESPAHVRVIEEPSAYWRVRFENPPFNIVDATILEGLQDLLARMDASPSLRVVVFSRPTWGERATSSPVNTTPT
jgi:enoyl-CoA hydratase/carnithine racemase